MAYTKFKCPESELLSKRRPALKNLVTFYQSYTPFSTVAFCINKGIVGGMEFYKHTSSFYVPPFEDWWKGHIHCSGTLVHPSASGVSDLRFKSFRRGHCVFCIHF